MAMSEARKRANAKWDAANKDRYYRPSVLLPAAIKPDIEARVRATKAGGVSDYIRSLVERDIQQQASKKDDAE